MSNSTRRDRERIALRQRIVDAALRVLTNEGTAALTIRRIATEIEYKAPVVYEHFANKDALVVELVTRGFDLMLSELADATSEPNIDQRVLQTGIAYVRFARQRPHLYEIMNSTVVDPSERGRAAAPAIAVVSELLSAWADAHQVVLNDRTEACEIVWGTLSGMASLGTINSERAQKLAEQALTAILLGWQSGDVGGITLRS
jgi:AcrR family transcriptional regulator